MRTVRIGGTARFPCAVDRRRWEPLPTGEIISARYEGASPLVDKRTKLVLDSLTNWKPVQLITQIVRNVIELPLSRDLSVPYFWKTGGDFEKQGRKL